MNSPPEINSTFPYSQLLAYRQGMVDDPQERSRIEQLIEEEPRWAAHWKSLEHLELEQVAAKRDGLRLASYPSAEQVIDIAVEVARSDGLALEDFLNDRVPPPWTLEQWQAAVEHDDFCRRMLRQVLARLQSRQANLPQGELLARDWLLERYYRVQLQGAKRRLGNEAMDRLLRDVVEVARECAFADQQLAELTELRREVSVLARVASRKDASTSVPATVADQGLLVTLAGTLDDENIQITRPLPGTMLLETPAYLKWRVARCSSYTVSILPISLHHPTLLSIELSTSQNFVPWPAELVLASGDHCQWTVTSSDAPEVTLCTASFSIADARLAAHWTATLERLEPHATSIAGSLATAWAAMSGGLVDHALEILDSLFNESAEDAARPVVTSFHRKLFARLADRLARQSDWSLVAARMANEELVRSVCQILGNTERRQRGECGACGECGLVKE